MNGPTGGTAPATTVIAANFTVDPIERPLGAWLSRLGLPYRLALAPYRQVGQQLLDPHGVLNQPGTGFAAILVLLEGLRLAGGLPADPAAAHEEVGAGVDLLAGALRRSPALGPGRRCLLLVTPATPRLLAMPGGPVLQRELEDRLARAVAGLPVTVIGSSEIAGGYPVEDYYDARGHELADVPYTPAQFAALATLLARRLRAEARPPRKALVVDCDGVLWSGSCGEDGPRGVSIEGPHHRMQRFMVEQARLGTLVCLCSKNSEADVMAVFAERTDMPLRREHLAAWRINWKPKSANLADLGRELAVGPEAMVFIDDSPLECADVESNCPAVLTLGFPAHDGPSDFCDRLWAFDRAYVTEEDGSRAGSHRRARSRAAAQREFPSYAAFIRSLDLRVTIEPMTPGDANRMAQLSVRTNQFNATGIRRTPGEMLALLDRPDRRCLVVRVRDRFEDYGLVGGVVAEVGAPDRLRVESLFLSCRTLGRGVEHQIVARLGVMALERGLAEVELPVTATPRNEPLQQFAAALPGTAVGEGTSRWAVRLPAGAAAVVSFDPDRAAPAASGDAVPGWLDEESAEAVDENAILRQLAAGVAAPIGDDAPAGEPAGGGGDPIEARLHAMWEDLLGLPSIGAHDNFFELGGTSLAAFRLLSRIRAELDVDLDANVLFDTGLTLATLATAVRAQRLVQVEPAS
jgi:FkbH-like protein